MTIATRRVALVAILGAVSAFAPHGYADGSSEFTGFGVRSG
jgi:hypothetical protein